MLREFGCEYVIIGHSERRSLFKETDELIAKKFLAALGAGLTPILCVGETKQQHETGQTLDVVTKQLQAVVNLAGIESFARVVIAYEPVWAIGTGLTATPEQAQEVHAFIRGFLTEEVTEKTRIIYGGSIKANNAADLFKQADIDGGLVGGASLQVEDFIAVCNSID